MIFFLSIDIHHPFNVQIIHLNGLIFNVQIETTKTKKKDVISVEAPTTQIKIENE
jgi:hypothetical protein